MRLERLLQCFWFILGSKIGLTMVTLSSAQAGSFTTVVSLTLPTPKPSQLSQHLCSTGPQFNSMANPVDNSNLYSLAVTDHIYLDNSEPVPCSGVITRWHYCYVTIGFHNVSSGLWPCVWRRSELNDSSAGYERIGCNEFAIIPGERDGLQCRYFTLLSPSDFIRVEEGDYIGFYVPDAGLFLPFYLSDDDTDSYQLQRIATGFAPFIRDDELRNATTHPGRALLNAEIDTDYILPSTTVSSTLIHASTTPVSSESSSALIQIISSPTPQPTAVHTGSGTADQPVTTIAAVAGAMSTTLLVVGVVTPSVITLIVVVVVTTSLICVYRKRYLKYKRFHSATADFLPKLLENPSYNMVSHNQVVIGNQLTFVDCNNNPAYNHGRPTVRKLETFVQVKNQAYNILSANHVIIGKQQTTVDLSDNPAYDPMTPTRTRQPKSKTEQPSSIASSAGKSQLEHTYESLSSHYAYPYHAYTQLNK